MVRVPVSKTGGWGFESLLPCIEGTLPVSDSSSWHGSAASQHVLPVRQACHLIRKVRVSETTGDDAVAKRRSSTAARGERGNVFQRLGLWYRQIVAELRKVIWPTRKELVAYTIVTVIFAAVMITLVASLDYGANWLVLKVFG